MSQKEKMYKKNLAVLLFVLTIFLCSAAEIILLEVKYQFFTGGFLQAHEVRSAGQRAAFVLVFLTLNIFLYGGAFLVWHYCLKKLNVKNNIIAFNFMMVAGIVTTVSLVVQFQLHKYFADAMNLALIKNIAGGDCSPSKPMRPFKVFA